MNKNKYYAIAGEVYYDGQLVFGLRNVRNGKDREWAILCADALNAVSQTPEPPKGMLIGLPPPANEAAKVEDEAFIREPKPHVPSNVEYKAFML